MIKVIISKFKQPCEFLLLLFFQLYLSPFEVVQIYDLFIQIFQVSVLHLEVR